MPACDGRPSEPCPDGRRDKSVHSTQGDLWLCDACERARFPEAFKFESKRTSSRTVKKTEKNIGDRDTNLPTKSTNESTAAVDPAPSGKLAENADKVNVSVGELWNVINGLRAEVDSLRLELRTVKEVLSNVKASTSWPPLSTGSSDTDADSAHNIVPPWPMIRPLVAAVHCDMSDKQRRARNVVVSGLPPSEDQPDADLFTAMCEKNLPVKPLPDRTRRLGRRVDGKIQPLLVTLHNEQSAKELLLCSAQLRKSTDDRVKQVYINRDLTPAEALASYQQRQWRREKQRSVKSSITAVALDGHCT